MTPYRNGAFFLRNGKLARFCWPEDHQERVETLRHERATQAERRLRADWRRRVAWRLHQEGLDNQEISAVLDIHPMTISQYLTIRKWKTGLTYR